MLGDYTGRHRAAAGAPTQVAFPWRATLRTIVQAGIPLLISLGVIVPEVVRIIMEESGESLPAGFRATLLSIAAFFTVLAAIIARVMAIPAVNSSLKSVGLSAEPK